MAIPQQWQGRLRLPVVAAPMFLVSFPQMVMTTCKNGVVGTFPSLNQRSAEGFDDWLFEIEEGLDPAVDAPYGVNLIVNRNNPRVEEDLQVCKKHQVPLIITSLGAISELVDEVHGWGGLVFHDVTTRRHAEKAIEAGVDGLILVSAGAGGHAGRINPFAFVPEIRAMFDGTLLLGGCIGDGRGLAAARALGVDMGYIGTRFINTQEAAAPDEFKDMIIAAGSTDVIYTDAISGVHGNFLKPSIVAAGLDPENLPPGGGKYKTGHERRAPEGEERKAWKNIWSAGQGVANITDVPTIGELVDRLEREYMAARGAA